MKKHNASKVVLITILVFLLLTWILPAAYYSGEYIDQGRVQMGLFDLFNYPLTSMSYFGYISFYFILVGGFYGILYKIPAYRNFLDRIVASFKGKEKLFLSLMVVLIAALVSICGVQFGIALFIPFVVSLVLLMGYDKVVAAFVTVGSIAVGLLGSTYADSNLSILRGAFSLDNNYQIGVRFVLLVAGIALVIFNMLMYIKRNNGDVKIEKKTVKKVESKVVEEVVEVEKEKAPAKKAPAKSNSSKSVKSNGKKPAKKSTSKTHKSVNKAALKEEDIIVVKENVMGEELFVPATTSESHKTWPIVVVFCLLFVLFVLAFIPWSTFNVAVFDDATSAVQKFELFGFPLFSKVLGTFNSFGNWTITDMFLPMTFVVILLSLIYNVSFKELSDGFVEGAKKALAPATVALLVYTILVLVTYHPFQLTIYKAILGLAKGFNIATTAIVAILAGLFNSDIAYSFQSVVPYYTSVVTNVDNYSLSAIIFQSMYGLTMLVAPTSLILMGVLAYLDIPYKEWLKKVWRLLLELFVVLLIVFIILALI